MLKRHFLCVGAAPMSCRRAAGRDGETMGLTARFGNYLFPPKNNEMSNGLFILPPVVPTEQKLWRAVSIFDLWPEQF